MQTQDPIDDLLTAPPETESQETPKQETPKEFPEMTRLRGKYPTKGGLERSIIHLFDGFEGAAYRINYFDRETETFPESHFVLVQGPDSIIEL